jgi:hypothetical protein
MKKIASTLVLVLAVTSLSMAKSFSIKSVFKKKTQVQVRAILFCDDAGHVTGAIGPSGMEYGNTKTGRICG